MLIIKLLSNIKIIKNKIPPRFSQFTGCMGSSAPGVPSFLSDYCLYQLYHRAVVWVVTPVGLFVRFGWF